MGFGPIKGSIIQDYEDEELPHVNYVKQYRVILDLIVGLDRY